MSLRWIGRTGIGLVLLLVMVPTLEAQDNLFTEQKPPPVVGRWNLTVHGLEREYPSWLEVRQSGFRTLVGSFVGQLGSARPISKVEYDNGRVRLTVPPQFERRTSDLIFEGKLEHDVLRGETTDENDHRITWKARRAPTLKRAQPPRWGKPIELFNGRDLTGWKPRFSGTKNGWLVREGVLTNAEPGNDLLTEKQFTDFKLHAEFRYPRGSNSGIYLRGRYEVQIEDGYGEEPDSHRIGGVYGFLTPCVNAAKKSDEWQTLEVTLVGRTVTVMLNGERVIDRQAIPGTTGGALESNESEPGPILLQGDHGPVEFRNMTLALGTSGPSVAQPSLPRTEGAASDAAEPNAPPAVSTGPQENETSSWWYRVYVIATVATAFVAIVALLSTIRLQWLMKSSDVMMDFQRRYGDLTSEPRASNRDEALRYYRRFWGLQQEQFARWLEGLIPDATFWYWMKLREIEFKGKRGWVAPTDLNYGRAWDVVKKDLYDHDFTGLIDVLRTRGIQEAFMFGERKKPWLTRFSLWFFLRLFGIAPSRLLDVMTPTLNGADSPASVVDTQKDSSDGGQVGGSADAQSPTNQ